MSDWTAHYNTQSPIQSIERIRAVVQSNAYKCCFMWRFALTTILLSVFHVQLKRCRHWGRTGTSCVSSVTAATSFWTLEATLRSVRHHYDSRVQYERYLTHIPWGEGIVIWAHFVWLIPKIFILSRKASNWRSWNQKPFGLINEYNQFPKQGQDCRRGCKINQSGCEMIKGKLFAHQSVCKHPGEYHCIRGGGGKIRWAVSRLQV